MSSESFWTVERRPLDSAQQDDWQMTACGMEYEAAERHYFEHMAFLQGHEMRLLSPDGRPVRHCSDPCGWSVHPARIWRRSEH